jgi:cytidine deaminase
MINDQLDMAISAKANAYAPYSKFHVGAAIETKNGKIFVGCNVENASFGLTICAERVAVCTAIVNGEKDFISIIVASSSDYPVAPCGACRQMLAEFSPDIDVIMVGNGTISRSKLSKLLPDPFNMRMSL